MRILVLSDSHRNRSNLRRAMKEQPGAEVILFLGDGEDDLEAVRWERTDAMLLSVAGNCDFVSPLPYDIVHTFDNTKIFMTHGHRYQVKSSLSDLEEKARREGAQIALYGHTHIPKIDYKDHLHLMCPGSVSGCHPTYGIIDLTPAGVVCNIVAMQ